MYRADYIAYEIYDRARAWTRASFFKTGVFEWDGVIYFTNGVELRNLTHKDLLICDLTEGNSYHQELLIWDNRSPYLVDGWMSVHGGVIDEKRSGLMLNDYTKEIQQHLDRLRMREVTLNMLVARSPGSAARLFRPDHEEISKKSDVPASTVRGFFEGRRVDDEARTKILAVLKMRPEELEVKLWER